MSEAMWGKAIEDQDVPFNANGDQHHYPEWYDKGLKWKTNSVFPDTLTYDGYSRGRSAAYFQMTRKNGRSVTVFLKDFEAMIPHLMAGSITGMFTFCKRGMNYGCKFVSL